MTDAKSDRHLEAQSLPVTSEVLNYILDMIEQLAEMAIKEGADDLANDLLAVHAEATWIYRGGRH